MIDVALAIKPFDKPSSFSFGVENEGGEVSPEIVHDSLLEITIFDGDKGRNGCVTFKRSEVDVFGMMELLAELLKQMVIFERIKTGKGVS